MQANYFQAQNIAQPGEFPLDDVEHKFDEFGEELSPVWEDRPFILAADHMELTQMLQTLHAMRQDRALCDVVINVSGTKFPAHKAVLCSCSRWLRSLVEHEDSEIQLDMLNAESFPMILDYIYAQPVEITEEACDLLREQNVDALLSIARRLGLQRFEQRCWSYLLIMVNPTNCMKLHELADKYECAPLKLSAWRIIQESYPGYAVAPARLLETKDLLKDPNALQDDESSLGEEIPSIFAVLTEEDMANYVPPAQLPEGSPAETVVKSWAIRLQLVWQECHPGAQEFDFHRAQEEERRELDGKEDETQPLVDYNEELVRFYMVHNPDKLRDVPEILGRFTGKEEEMLLSLYSKYNVALPPDLDARIRASHNGASPYAPYAQYQFSSPGNQPFPPQPAAYGAQPFSPQPTATYGRQPLPPQTAGYGTQLLSSQPSAQPFSPQTQPTGQPFQPHPSGTGIEQFKARSNANMSHSRTASGLHNKPSFRNAFDIEVDQTVETNSKDEFDGPPSPGAARGVTSRFGRNKSSRSMRN